MNDNIHQINNPTSIIRRHSPASRAFSVAVVCDSMSAYGGAERVIEQILELYPLADVFALVDVVPAGQRDFLGDRVIRTSFLQRLPRLKGYYRSLLPLWPIAIEQFDVTDYDVVISCHHSVAYGVITRPGQVHIAYVFSPMRYAWDLQHEYLREAGLNRGVKSWFARRMLHSARLWDFCAAQRPDVLVAISDFIGDRLRRIHHRSAETIYPPVAVNAFAPPRDYRSRDGFYLSVGRLVPYKRTDMLARAFARMPNRRIKIVGSGPDMAKLQAIKAPNVEILGNIPTHEVHRLMAAAEAFLFAGVEDFGITAVEVQAAGTPVIAYSRGGLAETVIGLGEQNPTGLFFNEQTEDAIIRAVEEFERPETRALMLPENCVQHAARFSTERFRTKFAGMVSQTITDVHGESERRALIRRAATD